MIWLGMLIEFLEIDSLKLRSIPPKHDINESLKAMRISIDECKERIFFETIKNFIANSKTICPNT